MKNMKKLLYLIGSFAITSVAVTGVVACSTTTADNPLDDSFAATYTATEDGVNVKSANLGLTKNTTTTKNYDFNMANLNASSLNAIVIANTDAPITNPIYLNDASAAPTPMQADIGIAVASGQTQMNITNINQVVTFKITLTLWKSQLKSGSSTAYEYVATNTTKDINISLTVLAAPLKTNLNTITLNSTDSLTVGQNLTYGDIELANIQSDSNFTTHPLADNFTIQYYSDAAGNNLIPATQTVPSIGTARVYVKVTAAANDSYWTGTTKVSPVNLTVTVVKTNLNTLTLPNDARVSALQGQSYDQINSRGIEDSSAFTTNNLADGYTLTFYSDASGASPINKNTQVPTSGDYTAYVKVTAAANDPYWTGSTKISPISFRVNE